MKPGYQRWIRYFAVGCLAAGQAAAQTAVIPKADASAPAAPAPVAKAASVAVARTPGTRARTTTRDRIDLDASQITGNRELPKVLYIVPWKRPDLGDLLGKPVNSLLDEVLAPVDRDVFRRENRYFEALQPDSRPAAEAVPTVAPAGGTNPPPAVKPES